jgi:hypothetical protein
MLLTEPIFCHPYTPDPLHDGRCKVCGAGSDKAIHDRRWGERRDLWGGRQWWPRPDQLDGTSPLEGRRGGTKPYMASAPPGFDGSRDEA